MWPSFLTYILVKPMYFFHQQPHENFHSAWADDSQCQQAQARSDPRSWLGIPQQKKEETPRTANQRKPDWTSETRHWEPEVEAEEAAKGNWGPEEDDKPDWQGWVLLYWVITNTSYLKIPCFGSQGELWPTWPCTRASRTAPVRSAGPQSTGPPASMSPNSNLSTRSMPEISWTLGPHQTGQGHWDRTFKVKKQFEVKKFCINKLFLT